MFIVPFMQPVKIAGFAMTGNPMAPANASGPKSVKLFVNALNMDFAAATNGTPAQEVELPASGQHVDLKVAKFNNVHTLTVMVSSNQKDSEFTSIGSMTLYGASLGEVTNMKELKKC